jgi:hypothetical protein
MPEKDNQFLPLGICQKLFDFIINSLIAPGLKRVTLGHPLPHQDSIKVPVDDCSISGLGSMEEQQPLNGVKPNGASSLRYRAHGKSPVDLGSEIQINFLETDELENWTSVDELGSSVHVSKMDGPIDTGAQAQLVNSDEKEVPLVDGFDISKVSPAQGKSSQEIEPIFTTTGRAKGPKKSVTLKDMTEEEKRRQKGKNIVSEDLTLATEPEATQMKPPAKQSRPRFTVGANINEKSDEFIKSRKEAMRNPRNS